MRHIRAIFSEAFFHSTLRSPVPAFYLLPHGRSRQFGVTFRHFFKYIDNTLAGQRTVLSRQMAANELIAFIAIRPLSQLSSLICQNFFQCYFQLIEAKTLVTQKIR